MLNYRETTSCRNIVPATPFPQSKVPSHPSFPPECFSYAMAAAYAIGPLEPAQVTTFPIHLSMGEQYRLLVPLQLSPALLAHPIFQDGCTWGCLEGTSEEERWTFPKLLNELYASLEELYHAHPPDLSPWTLGVLLGMLARIAEHDQTLALTGLAHFCFLLPLYTHRRPADWPRREPYHAYLLHRDAMKTYRAQVRTYRKQGKSFDEAQRLALRC